MDKIIAVHNLSIKATGGGPGMPELSQMDQRHHWGKHITGTCSNGDSECLKKASFFYLAIFFMWFNPNFYIV